MYRSRGSAIRALVYTLLCFFFLGCAGSRETPLSRPLEVIATDIDPNRAPISLAETQDQIRAEIQRMNLSPVNFTKMNTTIQTSLQAVDRVYSVSFRSNRTGPIPLKGWCFFNGRKSQSILVNPSDQRIVVNVNPLVQDTTGRFQQDTNVSADQFTYLAGGVATGRLSLPPHSLTRIY